MVYTWYRYHTDTDPSIPGIGISIIPILSMVKLEQKDTVLFQFKEAFETLVANFAKEKETNTSLWGQNIHGRRKSRKDDHDKNV